MNRSSPLGTQACTLDLVILVSSASQNANPPRSFSSPSSLPPLSLALPRPSPTSQATPSSGYLPTPPTSADLWRPGLNLLVSQLPIGGSRKLTEETLRPLFLPDRARAIFFSKSIFPETRVTAQNVGSCPARRQLIWSLFSPPGDDNLSHRPLEPPPDHILSCYLFLLLPAHQFTLMCINLPRIPRPSSPKSFIIQSQPPFSNPVFHLFQRQI